MHTRTCGLSWRINNHIFYRRYLEAALTGAVSRNKIRLIFGARQTGKTALVRHLLRGQGTHFVNLQESAERRRLEVVPAVFTRQIRGLPRSTRTIVVGEIQKVPALLDEVQALYDAAPSRWQFFLTGSSARRLRAGAANLLPGRSHGFHLHPVCAWEVAHDDASQIEPPTRAEPARPPFPVRPLARTLLLGSLPGVRAERALTAHTTLATYVGTYLEEEIRREVLVRDVGSFVVFLRLAAAEPGQQLNLAKLSQESGVPASTLKNYYQVLVDTFVGQLGTRLRAPHEETAAHDAAFLLL